MLNSVSHFARWPMTIFAALFALAACNQQAEVAVPAASPSQEYNLSLGIIEFMNQVVDPTADELWGTAGWVNSTEGYYELYPTTDEEWNRVRQHAATIVEIGNMLALPGRAVEDERWQVYAQGISSAGIMAMNAAAEQNEEDYFQAGARLYSVCSACHQAFNPAIASPIE